MYDLVLLEKSGIDGLTFEEFQAIYAKTKNVNQFYPIEIMAKKVESSAMGLISVEVADKLDYDYTKLSDFISDIMDDMDNETEDGVYEFEGLSIYLTREIEESVNCPWNDDVLLNKQYSQKMALEYMQEEQLPEGWEKTDDLQFCKRIDGLKYELIEANEVDGKYIISEPMTIDLNEYLYTENGEKYPTPEAASIIKSYYMTVEKFIEDVPDKDTRYQYLAEMIYESTSQFLPDCNYQRLLTGDEAEEIMREYCKSGEISDIIYAGIEE